MRAGASTLVLVLTLVCPRLHAARDCAPALGHGHFVHARWGGWGTNRWIEVRWRPKSDVGRARLLEFLEDAYRDDPAAEVNTSAANETGRKLGWRARLRFWFDHEHARLTRGHDPERMAFGVKSLKFGPMDLECGPAGDPVMRLRVRNRWLRDEKFLEALAHFVSATARDEISPARAYAEISEETSAT